MEASFEMIVSETSSFLERKMREAFDRVKKDIDAIYPPGKRSYLIPFQVYLGKAVDLPPVRLEMFTKQYKAALDSGPTTLTGENIKHHLSHAIKHMYPTKFPDKPIPTTIICPSRRDFIYQCIVYASRYAYEKPYLFMTDDKSEEGIAAARSEVYILMRTATINTIIYFCDEENVPPERSKRVAVPDSDTIGGVVSRMSRDIVPKKVLPPSSIRRSSPPHHPTSHAHSSSSAPLTQDAIMRLRKKYSGRKYASPPTEGLYVAPSTIREGTTYKHKKASSRRKESSKKSTYIKDHFLGLGREMEEKFGEEIAEMDESDASIMRARIKSRTVSSTVYEDKSSKKQKPKKEFLTIHSTHASTVVPEWEKSIPIRGSKDM